MLTPTYNGFPQSTLPALLGGSGTPTSDGSDTLDTSFTTPSDTLIRDIMIKHSEEMQDYQDQWTEQNVGCLIAQVIQRLPNPKSLPTHARLNSTNPLPVLTMNTSPTV